MPKLERLEWIAPLAEGRGVTLSNDPSADLFLAESPIALLLGVLYDSQLATRMAFAAPMKLRDRLGHLDVSLLADEQSEPLLVEVFSTKPALHRFPRKFALLTGQLAREIVNSYGGQTERIWIEAMDADDLSARLMALPAFGTEKTDWTVGMLGRLGMLPFDGWDGYRIAERRTHAAR